jgi:two-component system LytT family response regulator
MAIQSLIVEDDLLSMAMLKDLLEDFFPEVLIAGMTHTVRDSLEFLEDHQVDMLFLDIQLPDGNGFDILNRKAKAGFKVVVTTSYPYYPIENQIFSIVDFIVKPVSKSAMRRAIDIYLKTISDPE